MWQGGGWGPPEEGWKLRGGWFVYASRSLPFPAILTLSARQVTGGLVPTVVLSALPVWVLTSPCCAGTFCPQKPPQGP